MSESVAPAPANPRRINRFGPILPRRTFVGFAVAVVMVLVIAFVGYHTFDDQRTGVHLAHEWDAQFQAAINPKLTAALKYANFKRVARVPTGTATPPPSRTKVWFTLEYKL